MLYHLVHGSFIKLITYRAALAAIFAFLLCLLLGGRVIAWLRRRRIGERIEKKESVKLDELLGSKRNTPTMGGLFVGITIILAILIFGNFLNPALYALIFTMTALMLVGACDDWLKLTGRNPSGLSMFEKLLLQVLVGFLSGYLLYKALLISDPVNATRIYFPRDGHIDLGVYYPTFVMLIIVGFSNAVNITDGLDGLAGGCLVVATIAFAVLAYAAGRVDISQYLQIPYQRASAETTVFCTAMLGACLGFLWFNSHPAQIFLGDVGSLPLGGVLGLIACIAKQEVLLFLVGGVFVIEALSSLAQIVSYKLFKRRIFLIAPLHHHLQFKGMPESKIMLRFWVVSVMFAVASFAFLKLRY